MEDFIKTHEECLKTKQEIADTLYPPKEKKNIDYYGERLADFAESIPGKILFSIIIPIIISIIIVKLYI